MRIRYMLLGLLWFACVAPPRPETFQKDKVVNYPFDETWSAIVEALAEEEWPIESIEKESGLITTRFVNIGKGGNNYADCGSTIFGKAERSDFRCKLNVFARPIQNNNTNVRINIHIEGWTGTWASSNGDWEICNSTGKYEERLFSRILTILKQY